MAPFLRRILQSVCGLPFTETESGVRKQNTVWDLRSQTRKGGYREFLRIFFVGSKRPRGWVSFTGNAPSVQATLAEVRELSGWWHTQATDYYVRNEGLVLLVKPEALSSFCGQEIMQSSDGGTWKRPRTQLDCQQPTTCCRWAEERAVSLRRFEKRPCNWFGSLMACTGSAWHPTDYRGSPGSLMSLGPFIPLKLWRLYGYYNSIRETFVNSYLLSSSSPKNPRAGVGEKRGWGGSAVGRIWESERNQCRGLWQGIVKIQVSNSSSSYRIRRLTIWAITCL